MLCPTYEITTTLYDTHEIIIPVYEIAIIKTSNYEVIHVRYHDGERKYGLVFLGPPPLCWYQLSRIIEN